MQLLLKTAEAKMKSATKLVKIREVREDYLESVKELKELEKKTTATPSTAGSQKRHKGRKGSKGKQQAKASGGAEADDKQEVVQAAEELAEALMEAKKMEERLERERAQLRQVAWRLGAEKNAVRDRTVSQAQLAEWSTVRLKCSSATVRDSEALQAFMAKLAEAPCLEVLELSLGNRTRTRRALRKVLRALPAAPAKIKELALIFGEASREDMIALLGRVSGHLEKLTVGGPYQHAVYDSPDDLQRFWTALEGTGLKVLDVPGDCLKLKDGVEVQLQAAKWRLESLSASFGLGGASTLLPALIRANATSLRKIKVAGVGLPKDLKAVFLALAECSGLEDAMVPCCKEVAALERCSALTKLTVMASNLFLSGGVEDISTLARTLSLPAVADRLESLSLLLFKMGIEKKSTLVVYRAIRHMRKLKSLSVSFCVGFAAELKATLKSLPLLEELHLADGDDSTWQPRVLYDIAPGNAPALKLVRLDPDLLGSSWRTADAARSMQERFSAVGRQLEVRVEKDLPAKPGSAESDRSSDEEDDDGETDDGGSDDSVSDEEDSASLGEEEEDAVDDDVGLPVD